MKGIGTVATAAMLSVFVTGAASAATISFNINKSWSTSGHTYGNGSESVHVEAWLYGDDKLPTVYGNPELASWSGIDGGLGIWSSSSKKCSESHQIDGCGANEMAVLDFGASIVKLTQITFAKGYSSAKEMFDLFAFGNGTGSSATLNKLDLVITDKLSNCPASGCTVDVSGFGFVGSIFGIGAYRDASAFKVKGVSFDIVPPVPEVPLPAAGWMLVAGLGGLAALRRKATRPA
jgi:hypothetical protein